MLNLAKIRRLSVVMIGTVVVATALSGCGEKKKGGGGGGGPSSSVERAFHTASSSTGIPARLMMAVAYLESGLSPQNAQAKYVDLKDSDQQMMRGTLMTETAFGLTYAELGLDPKDEASSTLETQIDAYAKWVASKTEGLNLAPAANTPETQYDWIQLLATEHRKGQAQRRNVQVIFARELIEVLNNGFVWQDARNGEVMTLTAENPKIDTTKFPLNGQQWLSLDVRRGQFIGIEYLRLNTTPTDEITNHPKRIEVIHCPLSLSSCLELQTRNEESDVHIAAHYIIPQDNSVFDYVVQVADQSESIVITNSRGVNESINDRVVVMLVGNSGRTVAGVRTPANPTWFTPHQLKTMGSLINDVCKYMESQTPKEVKFAECIDVKGDKGVVFRSQGNNEEYRWGEIPDYDPTIFEAYVRNYSGLDGEVAFSFPNNNITFTSGSLFPLNLLFGVNARHVQLERLARCKEGADQDGKVVWETRQNRDVFGRSNDVFNETLYDSGPNRNGDQFYRARVYGEQGDLIGWTIARVVLRGYSDTKRYFASDSDCRFN